ncbi:HWE histidine kinase domain-containing protein [Phenylobacterium sp.]|uniref:HWE histidine kinase domain-containing protein n=1 Tax=Phenylobacterium sp. TaxID=1871053 RepID=UPI002E35A3CB|nr:HWE histidine kinase domain-containing protein [Phenylobacterium sp.]HEX4710090.1 HWE histidine kinase domain-containing protein [Phenylobacterium sp.]
MNGLAEPESTAILRPPGPPDFRAVFDASPRPLLLIAADPPKFTMLAVNPAHAGAFGTTPEALQGWGVLEVFAPDPPPAVAEFVEAVRTSLEAVIATRAPDQMGVRAYGVPASDGGTDERYWSATNSPILGADGQVTHILSAVQDVTGEVLERRSEDARRLLMREVDHRARNALTVVQSFVRLTTAPSLEDYRRVVDGRVEALARAQTSLAARRWEGASLHDVVEGELAAMSQPGQYSVSGHHLLLRADAVQAMSMVIHELATNASKYGALSTEDGTLSVGWDKSPAGGLTLIWSEAGGPAVEPPTREGFGSRLISQLTRQMGGDIAYAWRAEGLRAEINLPLGGG